MPATAMTNSATAYDLNRVVMLELRTGRLLLGTRPYLNTPTWLRAGSYASEPVFAELRAHDGAMADLRRNMRHISQTLHSMMDNRDLNNVAVLETVMREVEARKIVAVFAPTVTESAQDVSMLTLSQLMKSNKLQETRQGVVDNLKQILPRVPAQAQVSGGDRAKREMEQFFAPEHLETTAGVFELWAASSGTRDGFIIDAGMLSLAITYSGKAAMEAFNNLAGFFKIIEMDKPDEDHQKSAAYLLASAFIYLGLSTMKLILRKVAGRKGSAGGGGGGSDGKASSFAKRNPGALAAGPVPAPAPVVTPVAPAPKKDAAAVPAGRARTAAPVTTTVTGTHGANNVTWTLDDKGRPMTAEGTLKEITVGAIRSSAETSAQTKVGNTGLADDEGGHVVGHRFMGDQGEKNMFPQDGNFNKSAFKKLENEWADWTKSGKEVKFKTELVRDASGRPDKVRIAYEVVNPATGKTVYDNRTQFSNKAGESFARIAREDMDMYT
jgi:hypothetical protein